MSQDIAFLAGPAARRVRKQAVFAAGFLVLLFLVLALPFLWAGLKLGEPAPLLIGGFCLFLALGIGLVRLPKYDPGAPVLTVSTKGLRVFPATSATQRDPVELGWTQIAAIAVHHPPRGRPLLRITPTDEAARALGLRQPEWQPSALTRWTGARLSLPVDLFDCGQDALLRHLAEAAAQSDGAVRVMPRWDGGARLILAPAVHAPESAA